MSDTGKYFRGIEQEMICPAEYVRVMTGHTKPEDFDGEDSDLAFEREGQLMKMRLWVQHELTTIDKWIDDCKEIQAIALQNKEETDGNT